MKELRIPPPHNPRREEGKVLRGDHNIEHEENTPADAPDVENRHLPDQTAPKPTTNHPKACSGQRPS